MAPILLPPMDIAVRARQYTERTEGLHLSHITNDILIGLDPDRYGERLGETATNQKWMNFLAGLLFERSLELAWLDKEITGGYRPELIRPGEVRRDGVIGTPDAYDTRLGRPEEYKCTKKTLRDAITHRKFWIYWVQLKAYAYMVGANSGALWILFINGNYSFKEEDPDSGYIIRGWEDHWTPVQLEENWAMLMGHARKRGWV